MNRPLRILCVEDQPDMCQQIAKVMSGFEVVSAKTRYEALEKLQAENQFALFILDYHLPDGTGLQLCHDIRGADMRTPILFVTGSSNLTINDVRDAGGQGLLKKNSPEFALRLVETVSDLCSVS